MITLFSGTEGGGMCRTYVPLYLLCTYYHFEILEDNLPENQELLRDDLLPYQVVWQWCLSYCPVLSLQLQCLLEDVSPGVLQQIWDSRAVDNLASRTWLGTRCVAASYKNFDHCPWPCTDWKLTLTLMVCTVSLQWESLLCDPCHFHWGHADFVVLARWCHCCHTTSCRCCSAQSTLGNFSNRSNRTTWIDWVLHSML